MNANGRESNQATLHAAYLAAIRLGWLLLATGILAAHRAVMWNGVALLSAGSVMGVIWIVREMRTGT
jgi:Zn-dependent membrane protease YugP